MIGVKITKKMLQEGKLTQKHEKISLNQLIRIFEVLIEGKELLNDLLTPAGERSSRHSKCLDVHFVLDETVSLDFLLRSFRNGLNTVFLRPHSLDPNILEAIPPHHRGLIVDWLELSSMSMLGSKFSKLMSTAKALLLTGWKESTSSEDEDLMDSIEQITNIWRFNPKLKVYLEIPSNTTPSQLRRLLENGIHPMFLQAGDELNDNNQLIETFVKILDFDKNDGLIPTIVQDATTNQVLMVAYSNRDSLKEAILTGRGVYYSRTRQELWIKGQTSGNTQTLIRMMPDCDLDSLLFLVDQKGTACHLNQYSCFRERQFTLTELLDTLRQRVEANTPHSYTARMARDEQVLLAKIREECEEVINYQDRSNLIWELADLYYFTLVLMARNGITLEEVTNELERRKK